MQPVAYTEPDIWCGLPETAVRRAWPTSGFPGWDLLIDDWNLDTEQNFKKLVLRHLGLKQDKPDAFIERVLASLQPDDAPSDAC